MKASAIIALVVGSVCSISFGQEVSPNSSKLDSFARDLYYPEQQNNLYVVGDSINATNVPGRMHVGYRNQFDIVWNGWVSHADNGSSDNGYQNAQNVGSGLNAIRIPGDMFSDNISAITPVRARDVVFGNSWGDWTQISDAAFPFSALVQFPLGNPFSGNISAYPIFYRSQDGIGDIRIVATNNNNNAANVVVSPSFGLSSFGINFNCTGQPGCRIYTTSTSFSPGNQLKLMGVRYHNSNPIGTQFCAISHGGWRTIDHTDPSKYSDQAISDWFSVNGEATHIIIWLGQNQTVTEATQLGLGIYDEYKHDMEAVIDRYQSFAPSVKFLLVSQYQTGYSTETHRLMAKCLYDIAQERGNVSFLNLYELAGGPDMDLSYLADGVHPTIAGSNYFASLMDTEMVHCLVCPADFDHSGFVDIDDFDAFVQAFESGTDDADFDGSGFVDMDDFDSFVQAFENGC